MRSTIVSLSIATLLAACDSKAPSIDNYTVTTENGQSAVVSVDKGSNEVSIVTNEGNAQISVGARQETNLPAHIPAYPGAQMGMSMSGQGKGGHGTMVSMSTSDTPAKVVAFYQQQIAAAGLKPEVSVKGPNGFTTLTIKGDKGSGSMVTVIPSQGQTVISIVTGEDQ